MASEICMLKDINSDKETWRLTVKVDRCWFVNSKYGNKERCLFAVVLKDQQGIKIEAIIPKNLIKRYENIVREGVTYDLYNFRVEKPQGSVITTPHPYKIIFHPYTQMRRCDPLQTMKPEFHFVTFNDIQSQSEEEDKILTDIIAFVHNIHDVEAVSVYGKMTNKLDIDLKDIGLTIMRCTLWEGHYEKLLNYVTEHPSDPLIIVLEYAKVQKRTKGTNLSNSMHASRLTINGDIAAVHEFKQSVESVIGKIPPPTTPPQGKKTRPSPYEPFKDSMDVNCIADIDEIFEECYYVIVATIQEIENEYDWYYNACPKCLKKVTEHDGKIRCEKCDMELYMYDTRFKVVIRVVDDSGYTSLTLFDKEMLSLIHKTPKELLHNCEKTGMFGTIPKEIEGLVGRKFIFRFHISEIHLKKGWTRYAVVKLSDDHNLIQAIEHKKASNKDIAENKTPSDSIDVQSSPTPTEKTASSSISDNQCFNTSTPRRNKRRFVFQDSDEDDGNENECETSATKKPLPVKIEKN